jgi:hypothetical protein
MAKRATLFSLDLLGNVQGFVYDDQPAALSYKQEFGIEIRQQQKPKKAICAGPWSNSSAPKGLRANS